MLAETEKGKRCRFRAVLVDDLSRLSRDLGNTHTLVFSDLRMAGIAVIDVSTGMSSDRDGARLQFGASALVADMFLENVRKQTHRGLEGRALAGFWTGGRLYGYATKEEENPTDPEHPRKRLVINDTEAGVVRRVFEQYAAGVPVKEIARRLDADRVAPPSAGTKRGCTPGWGHSSIVAMIGNESYIGRFTWNRRRWITDPRSGARRYVERPRAEWHTREEPALAIVARDLWHAASARRSEARRTFPSFATGPVPGDGARGGSPPRHLLSGLLRCECGARVSIFGGKGESRSYACSAHKRNPALCGNGLTISKAKIERSVIGALRHELSAPDLVARMTRRLAERLRSKASGGDAELRQARTALAKADEKLRNLLALVEAGLASSRAVAERIATAEAERDAAAAHLAEFEARPKPADVIPSPAAVRAHVEALDRVLTTDIDRGREFLRRHVGTVTLTPQSDGPRPFYRASGRLFFSAIDPKTEQVAGAGFEPATRRQPAEPRRGRCRARAQTRQPVPRERVSGGGSSRRASWTDYSPRAPIAEAHARLRSACWTS
jgi:DNA invertase Pin-like site-specific DNA recombinase